MVEENKASRGSFFKKIWSRLREHPGIWYMLAANMIFACCTFSLKLIPADVFDIMIPRFLVQSLVFGIFATCYKGYHLFDTNGQPAACALNAGMSSLTNLLYLAAFNFLPLSDLNTIKYTYIVWAAILSVIFLKDRFKAINGIALLLTCFGLVLATKPHFFLKTFTHLFDSSSAAASNATIVCTNTTIANPTNISSHYYLGVILASVSALTKSIQVIARKKLVQKKQPYSVINFHFTITALFVSIIYSIVRRLRQSEPYPWKWMGTAGVIIGFFQIITNTLAVKALKRENVQLITILGAMDIIYAVILQYIFFRQTKSWIFYIGAALVVSSAIILSVDRHLETKREKKEQSKDGPDQHI